MKSMNKLSILIIIIITAFFFSCGDGADGTAGDIPKSSLSIPASLTDSASKNSARATSAGGTADSFFEPFRESLKIAEELLNAVNEIIDELNTAVIPDSWTGTQSNGDTVTVTTDTARDYSKRIEFTSSGSTAPYLQINYTPGLVKGVLYYLEEDSTASLEKIKIFYDETGSSPVLTGWLTIKEGVTGNTYPLCLYFNATKNTAGSIVFEGGASYNFVFGGHATWTADYAAQRAYMFKAIANSDGTKAKTALYFPLSSETSVAETMDVKNSFLDILYAWLVTENSVDINDLLGQSPGTITSAASLGSVLDSLDAAAIPDDIEFVLSLTNPIAYSETNGYEGNDNSYPSDAAYNLGDLGTITFTLSPSEIKALTSAVGSAFTFLSD